MKKSSVKIGKKQKGGKFRPGQSGNPAGRPKGSLNKTTIISRSLLEGKAKKITAKAIQMALAGDFQAINLILTRLIPPAKESPLNVKIKPPNKIKDIPKFTRKVLKQVGQGKILPRQGEVILRLVKTHIEAIEIASLEERILKLESSKEN